MKLTAKPCVHKTRTDVGVIAINGRQSRLEKEFGKVKKKKKALIVCDTDITHTPNIKPNLFTITLEKLSNIRYLLYLLVQGHLPCNGGHVGLHACYTA